MHGELGLRHSLEFGFRERLRIVHAGDAYRVVLVAHLIEVEGFAVLFGNLAAPVVHDEHVVMIGRLLVERDVNRRGGIQRNLGEVATLRAARSGPIAHAHIGIGPHIAADRAALIEIVPQHELVIPLGAIGIYRMAAPAIAVVIDERVVAVMTRMNQIAQIRPRKRRVPSMARFAIFIREVLIIAGFHQNMVVAPLKLHHVEQVAVARIASAVASVQHVGIGVIVGEHARIVVGEIRVRRCIDARLLLFGSALLSRRRSVARRLRRTPPAHRAHHCDCGQHYRARHEALLCFRFFDFHPFLLP